MQVAWPPELLKHRHCAPVALGDVCRGAAPGVGPQILTGLRVRMGVNTGGCTVVQPFIQTCQEAGYCAQLCTSSSCRAVALAS